MENSCDWYDISCGLKWMADELKMIIMWWYDALLSGLAKIIESIPVPDFLENIYNAVMTPEVSWFLDPFELPYGLGVMVTAYAARFLLRRVPFIG